MPRGARGRAGALFRNLPGTLGVQLVDPGHVPALERSADLERPPERDGHVLGNGHALRDLHDHPVVHVGHGAVAARHLVGHQEKLDRLAAAVLELGGQHEASHDGLSAVPRLDRCRDLVLPGGRRRLRIGERIVFRRDELVAREQVESELEVAGFDPGRQDLGRRRPAECGKRKRSKRHEEQLHPHDPTTTAGIVKGPFRPARRRGTAHVFHAGACPDPRGWARGGASRPARPASGLHRRAKVHHYKPSMPNAANELLILGLLIVANGVLTAAETALVAARREKLGRMAEAGGKGARAALAIAEHPGRFLAVVQFWLTLSTVIAPIVVVASAADEFTSWFSRWPAAAPWAQAIGMVVATLGLSAVMLVFGELLPKRIALSSPERAAAILGPPCAPSCALSALSRTRSARRATRWRARWGSGRGRLRRRWATTTCALLSSAGSTRASSSSPRRRWSRGSCPSTSCP